MGEDLASGDMNSEAFVMNQFLWDYHSWVEGVQMEVLLLVSASLGFVQNESTYGDLPYQTEDCLEVCTKISIRVWT